MQPTDSAKQVLHLKERRSAEEKIILIVSAISASLLLPLSILHLLVSDYWIAIVDGTGFVATLAILLHVYRTHEVEKSGLILALLAIVGMILNIYLKGVTEIFFLYPTLVAAYYLVRPGYAMIISILALLVLLPAMLAQLDTLGFAKIYLSILGCVLFSYAFTSQRNEQRDQLLNYSTRDSLTGAGNRRAMDARLSESIQLYTRAANPMSLIILDLDNFKQINDSAGHGVGDELLVRVTNMITGRIRATDSLFRYGGDEFIVLLQSADLSVAGRLAEDLRAIVEADLSISGWNLSISLGVAEYANGETQLDWLKRADQALFESKRQGRNRVVLSETPVAEALPAAD